ncbi:MAG: hypothetical protein B6U73_04630 [Desulfurococcales archaeon ex4484_204]|nr:MAG: hypothetical protein B6U73_04630 [Desulfurococcales archaeon ex4484_204]
MSIYKEFARKYFKECLKDLDRALRAIQFRDYPQAAFYSQQCVEKCAKAMLEVRRRVVYNHGPELLTVFIDAFSDEWRGEYDAVVTAMEFLTEYYTRARYPTLFRGKVYSPDDVVSSDVALKAVELAKKVVEVVGSYLRREGIITN